MQPQNSSNIWQPGDRPTAPAAPPVPPVTPVAPPSVAPPSPSFSAPQPPSPTAVPIPVPQQPMPSVAPVPQPSPAASLESPQPVQAFGGSADDQAAEGEEYDEGSYEEDEDDAGELEQPVNWQAKEFIHQEKNKSWYMIFGVVLVALLAVATLLMKSPSFAVLLVVIAVVIIVFAKRPPRTMSYSLSEKGLHIGDTLHSFADFKAFGVIHDGLEYSVMLIPTKRFMPGVSVYFPEESGEEIVDMLGSRLPMQDLHLDVIDRVVRTLRL